MIELNKTQLFIDDIMKVMPHRYPFILIDRIIELIPGKRCVALKNITINEPYFQGHFPGQPVMPGVLILESMAQAGAFLVLNSVDEPLKKNMFFSAVEQSKFRKPIVPGDQVRIEMELLKMRMNAVRLHGLALVDGIKVAEAIIMANIVARPGV